jgi:drug/metabolite transporter (DMT)-like permease
MPKKNDKYWWMLLAGVVLSTFLGIGLVALKGSISGAVFVILYDAITGIFLLRGSKSKLKTYFTSKTHLKILFFDTVLVAVLDYLIYYNAPFSGAAKLGIFSLLRPGIIYLLALKFLHEPFNLRVFIGTMISFSGAAMILILPVINNVEGLQMSDLGLVAGFILSGISIVITKKQFKYFELEYLVGLRSLAAAVLIAVVLILQGVPLNNSSASVLTWLGVIVLIIVCSGYAGKLEFKAISKIRAEDTVGVYLIGPAISVLAGVLLLSESFDKYSLMGSLVIFIGVAISHDVHHRLFHDLRRDEEKVLRFIKRLLRRFGVIVD